MPDVLATQRPPGLATLDYVLVLGVILPLAAFLFRVGPKIIAWRMKWCVLCVLAIYVGCRQARRAVPELGDSGLFGLRRGKSMKNNSLRNF